jgi:hypothetical protein
VNKLIKYVDLHFSIIINQSNQIKSNPLQNHTLRDHFKVSQSSQLKIESYKELYTSRIELRSSTWNVDKLPLSDCILNLSVYEKVTAEEPTHPRPEHHPMVVQSRQVQVPHFSLLTCLPDAFRSIQA